MSQERIKKLEADIEQAAHDYQAFLRRQEAERDAEYKRMSDEVAAMQEERNALALQIKLAEFPAELVEGHPVCSVCGAQMRPFNVARGGRVQKLWACQAGNLENVHDLVTVD